MPKMIAYNSEGKNSKGEALGDPEMDQKTMEGSKDVEKAGVTVDKMIQLLQSLDYSITQEMRDHSILLTQRRRARKGQTPAFGLKKQSFPNH